MPKTLNDIFDAVKGVFDTDEKRTRLIEALTQKEDDPHFFKAMDTGFFEKTNDLMGYLIRNPKDATTIFAALSNTADAIEQTWGPQQAGYFILRAYQALKKKAPHANSALDLMTDQLSHKYTSLLISDLAQYEAGDPPQGQQSNPLSPGNMALHQEDRLRSWMSDFAHETEPLRQDICDGLIEICNSKSLSDTGQLVAIQFITRNSDNPDIVDSALEKAIALSFIFRKESNIRNESAAADIIKNTAATNEETKKRTQDYIQYWKGNRQPTINSMETGPV
ncbi:MAG TPA: hypothetical protein VIF12_01530 [Micavibrio sp.]